MKNKLFFISLCLGLVIGGISSYFLFPFFNKGQNNIKVNKTIEKKNLIVYVSGAVNNPGIVKLSSDSRIFDAIKACGDFTRFADTTKINLSTLIEDGMHINIPSKENFDLAINENNDKININTATIEQLDKLPGIGPSMAKRIIEEREKSGSFKNVNDLLKIKGIGSSKLEKIKELIYI